jgi:hypothetical protein
MTALGTVILEPGTASQLLDTTSYRVVGGSVKPAPPTWGQLFPHGDNNW